MHAARRGLGLIARIVSMVTLAVAALIVVGILFQVFEANPRNTIVEGVTDAGRFLAGPFKSLFNLDDRKVEVAVNWGIGAAVWVAAGMLVARLLRR